MDTNIHNGNDSSLNNSDDIIEESENKVSRKMISRKKELKEMLNGLKQKFSSLPFNDPARLRILIVAPPSWSIRQIATEFGTTKYMAQKAKTLRLLERILPEMRPKIGVYHERPLRKSNIFTSETRILEFLASKKDIISVKS